LANKKYNKVVMTSTFNLSRRPQKKKNDWTGFFRNSGICPVGFTTEFVGHHDWKICRLERDEDGRTWQDGSANIEAQTTHFPPPEVTRTFSSTLYGPTADEPQYWIHGGRIPYNMRRQLHEPRAYFDRYGYYPRKTHYDGTGYSPTRWWPAEGGKVPQYADDNVEYPPVWDPYRSTQPYEAQEASKEGIEERWTSLTTRYGTDNFGCFYGDCASDKQFLSR
jgi:hypothetical protein